VKRGKELRGVKKGVAFDDFKALGECHNGHFQGKASRAQQFNAN
jgi:hypothetical protein